MHGCFWLNPDFCPDARGFYRQNTSICAVAICGLTLVAGALSLGRARRSKRSLTGMQEYAPAKIHPCIRAIRVLILRPTAPPLAIR